MSPHYILTFYGECLTFYDTETVNGSINVTASILPHRPKRERGREKKSIKIKTCMKMGKVIR